MVALLAVGGCASPTEPAEEGEQPTEALELVGTKWNCYEFKVSGMPVPVLESAPITAEFAEDGTLSGSSGVNTYTTTYEIDGESMTISGEIATTMMTGPEDAMNQESNYLLTLPTVQSFNMMNDELILLGPSDSLIARYRPAE
jgi:heat shock protein HslJ